MFGKRILNVEVYGDQTIYGIKSFKDQIVLKNHYFVIKYPILIHTLQIKIL